MKYGESAFDILYLLFAVTCGILMLVRARSRAGRLMGTAALVLGLGDAFHLVPRVIRYFSEGDLNAALGIGKLVTSLTMTFFYVLLFYVWREIYGVPRDGRRTASVWILAALRCAVCLFPQNGWLRNDADVTWGILRNIPFAALGAVTVILFFRCRRAVPRFRFIWLYALLSFLFYLPVAVGAGLLPVLGMLMLPKTVCYMLMVGTFLLFVTKDGERTVPAGEAP